MRKLNLRKIIVINSLIGLVLMSCTKTTDTFAGQTTISKWQGNKKAAVSITYDDGIISQFTVARPIMNNLNLPATFFVLTGKINGSENGKFKGRPKNEIIAETAITKTNTNNFFERASLIAFTGSTEAVKAHSDAGSLFESGKISEAYQTIDNAFEKLRNGDLKNTNDVVYHDNPQDTTSWDDLRKYAAEGHEIASHSITHPRMAVLDEVNLLYELEQSKADIHKHLGEAYTFSVECPYGTEDERVMEYAKSVYPALRNRMPETYLDEFNRSSDQDPVASEKEYVQWQRGPLTNTSMDLMKSWIDKCINNDHIWLVLVFHGVDNFGWEPKTADELTEYFNFIKKKENELWVATFADVTKYIRERKNIKIKSNLKKESIALNFSSDLDPEVYNVPLSFKTYIPENWKNIQIVQGEQKVTSDLEIKKDHQGNYIRYDLAPLKGNVLISEILQ